MDDKEITTPDTKSFDEQYGEQMRRELKRQKEEAAEEGQPLFEVLQEEAQTGSRAGEDRYGYDALPNKKDFICREESDDLPPIEAGEPASKENPSSFGQADPAVHAGRSEEEVPQDGDDTMDGGEPLPEDAAAALAEDDESGSGRPACRRRRKKHGCLISLIIIFVVAALLVTANTPLFAIQKIKVSGNVNYTADEIIAMSGIKKGDNLFRTRKGRIEKNLKQGSYIRSVVIDKKLPDTITLRVKERTPAAFVRYGSRYVILDSRGYVLRWDTKVPKLTEIDGMTIKSMAKGKRLEVSAAEMLRQCLAIISAMEKGDLFFKRLKPGKVLIKAYIYDNLVCRGTPKNLLAAIKDGSLKGILSDLYEKKKKKGTLYIGSGSYVSFTPKVAK